MESGDWVTVLSQLLTDCVNKNESLIFFKPVSPETVFPRDYLGIKCNSVLGAGIWTIHLVCGFRSKLSMEQEREELLTRARRPFSPTRKSQSG